MLFIIAALGLGIVTLSVYQHKLGKTLKAEAVATLQPASGGNMSMIPTVSEAAASEQAKSINIQGNSGSIVGQMAKIPTENDQITEIKTVSDVDNTAGRELLSIISKY